MKRRVRKAALVLKALASLISRTTAWALMRLIRGYQIFISPCKPPTCKYIPSCSQYALQAIKKRGPLAGLLFGMGRILRCHPFARGGYDPVPEKMGKAPEGKKERAGLGER